MPDPTNPPARRPGFWERPLGYSHAALVVLAAFAIGIVYHLRMPRVPAPPMGVAAAACAVFVLGVGAASIRWREARVMQWLTGIPFAIASIAGVMLVASVGAVVPAAVLRARLHMESVYSSWPFAMVLLVMLVNLVGVTARRMVPFSPRNVRFLLNHAGLAVALLGGAFSASGLQRVSLMLERGRPVAAGEDTLGRPVSLPFTATLRRFHLETFPPTLALIHVDGDAPEGYRLTPGAAFVKVGMAERIGDYRVRVEDYLPRAAKVGEAWRAVSFPTAAPAARVTVRDSAGTLVGDGWVSSGSLDTEQAAVRLAEDVGIVMMDPRPREFRSTVSFAHGGRTEEREIRVNHPVTVAGWRLYQVSYDERMGAASEFSGIEAVRDRGLPVVYAGLFLMLAGAAMLLWEGAREGGEP